MILNLSSRQHYKLQAKNVCPTAGPSVDWSVINPKKVAGHFHAPFFHTLSFLRLGNSQYCDDLLRLEDKNVANFFSPLALDISYAFKDLVTFKVSFSAFIESVISLAGTLMSVCCLVNFLKRREVTFICSYRSTCFARQDSFVSPSV